MERLPEGLGLLPSNFAVRATVLKVVELKATKEGVDVRAALKRGPMKITVDSDGVVAGSMGRVSMIGDPALKSLGASFKFMSITLSLKETGEISYVAKVSTYRSFVDFTVNGDFDIEKALFSDGYVKGAYDAIKNRHQTIEGSVSGQAR